MYKRQVEYAYDQWQKAVRDTKVNPGLTWLGALRPDIVEKQNAEIEAWGEKLAAEYENGAKTSSPIIQPACDKTLDASKQTQGASSSYDLAKPEDDLNATSYIGFIQQFEVDEYDDDEEIDFADDETFSSYFTMMKQNRF